MPVPSVPAKRKFQARQRIAGEDAAEQRDQRRDAGDEQRVGHPSDEQRTGQQVGDVLERRVRGPERRVVRRHPRPVELAVRPHRRHQHPIEREQQPENEGAQRNVEVHPAPPLRAFDHGSVHLDPADVEELHHHDDEQEREHGERNRGALAQQPGADADLIGVGGEQLRGVGRDRRRSAHRRAENRRRSE